MVHLRDLSQKRRGLLAKAQRAQREDKRTRISSFAFSSSFFASFAPLREAHDNHTRITLIRQAVDDSFDAVLAQAFVKFHEQSKTQTRQFQVGQRCLLENVLERLDRFQFYKDQAVHNQVSAEADTQLNPLIKGRNLLLHFHDQAAPP